MSLNSENCNNCLIRHQSICSRCPPEELLLLEEIKTYHTFAKGEMITCTGNKIHHIGTLVSGIASISKGLHDGRQQIMGFLLPSDFVGRPDQRIAQYDITAISEVVMCRFDIKVFESFLTKSPNLGPRLLKMALNELDATRDWMLLLGKKSAHEKVATFLHMIALKSQNLTDENLPITPKFTLPITRESLADYLGLTIETVSRQITKLRKDNVIEIQNHRQFTILDLPKLMELSGDNFSDSNFN